MKTITIYDDLDEFMRKFYSDRSITDLEITLHEDGFYLEASNENIRLDFSAVNFLEAVAKKAGVKLSVKKKRTREIY